MAMVSSTAVAQEAQDEETSGDIIVTGERINRSLLDTASSVSVRDSDAVEGTAQQSLFESLSGIPNVVIAEGEGLPAIRGQQSNSIGNSSAGALQTGSEQRSLLVVDDFARVSTFSNTAFNSLFDVDQIEVYRGPQSTLRGRSAIAGAIVVTTREPEFTFNGRALAEVTNDEVSGTGYRVAGAVSLPLISDTLAVRISGERNVDRDPVSGLLPGDYTGTAPFDTARRIEGTRANVKLRFEPSDGTRIDLLGNYVDAIVPLTRSTAAGPAQGVSFKDRIFAFGGDFRALNAEAYFIGGKISQRVGPGDLRILVGYGNEVIDTNTARNSSFVTFNPSDDSILSAEAFYSFESGRLEGLAGVSYARRETLIDADVFGVVNLLIDQNSETYAAYSDLRYAISDALQLNLGGRVLSVRQNRNFAFGAPIIVDERITDTAVLPQIGLLYTLSPEQRLNISLRKGYQEGGRGPNLSLGTTYSFDPETVWAAEASYRYQSSGGRFGLTVTGFYNWYRDQQFFVDLDTVPESAEVRNQPRSRSFGLEIEGRAKLDDRFSVTAGIGLLDTRIIEAAGLDVSDGNKFGFAPPVTLNLGVEWQPVDRLTISSGIAFSGGYFGDIVNDRNFRGGDYALVNAGIAYGFGPVTARVFVQNAFDELAFISRTGDNDARVTRPRTVGFSLAANF
ncbi:MAG: TonB-dependent receptor [Sphingopyxis sp.]|nr:TonB-dependent receptor [Sphingopyxis sp.]